MNGLFVPNDLETGTTSLSIECCDSIDAVEHTSLLIAALSISLIFVDILNFHSTVLNTRERNVLLKLNDSTLFTVIISDETLGCTECQIRNAGPCTA